MNIRFRMPKLWGNVKFQGTLTEIILSIIATTISIILTFGTAHYINEQEKKATARQTVLEISSESAKEAKLQRKLIMQS